MTNVIDLFGAIRFPGAIRFAGGTGQCALDCGIFATTTFSDWVCIARCDTRYLSHHLLHDLKHDNTLPADFDSCDQFRSYLRSQGACPAARRLAAPVWRRYQNWKQRVAS